MKSLICRLCKQVAVNPLRASHIFSRIGFVKVIKLVRKTFHSCNFRGIYVNREREEKRGSTRDLFEKGKKHLVFVIVLLTFFCHVTEVLIPKRTLFRTNFLQHTFLNYADICKYT